MGAKGDSLDRQAGNQPWNTLSPAGRPWAGRHLPQNARLPLPTCGARVRTVTKKKKMVWEAERPLPTGKILVAQLHRPGCPPCARHVGMMKLAKTQSYHSRNRKGMRREMDGGLGSSSLVGRQLGALAWEGAWEGQSPS